MVLYMELLIRLISWSALARATEGKSINVTDTVIAVGNKIIGMDIPVRTP